MAAYVFETITTAQALSFNSNFDTLAFTAPGSTASAIHVAYDTQGMTGDLAITTVLKPAFAGSRRLLDSLPPGGPRVRGRRMYQGGATFLPLRVNQAGVIPIIFAVSILLFPTQIASYFATPPNTPEGAATMNRLPAMASLHDCGGEG